jgi:glycosyltransferase involved in cell wall biosynthesis
VTGTRVSVVVPTRNSGRTLDACLASIRAQDHPDLELLVVDNDSSDDTLAIARRHAHRVECHGPERSAQRNHGTRVASGDVVMFVDSDMVLDRTVVSEAVAVLDRDRTVGAIIVDEVAVGEGWFVRCRVLEKELCVGDPSVEAGRVFRRAAVDAVGGYDESLYACEDWDLADRVAAQGWSVGRVQARIRHDEGRISLPATFGKKRYYGRNGVQWLSRSAGPTRRRRPIALLAATFRSRAPRVVQAGLVVLKATEWLGFAFGALERQRRPPNPAHLPRAVLSAVGDVRDRVDGRRAVREGETSCG